MKSRFPFGSSSATSWLFQFATYRLPCRSKALPSGPSIARTMVSTRLSEESKTSSVLVPMSETARYLKSAFEAGESACGNSRGAVGGATVAVHPASRTSVAMTIRRIIDTV